MKKFVYLLMSCLLLFGCSNYDQRERLSLPEDKPQVDPELKAAVLELEDRLLYERGSETRNNPPPPAPERKWWQKALYIACQDALGALLGGAAGGGSGALVGNAVPGVGTVIGGVVGVRVGAVVGAGAQSYISWYDSSPGYSPVRPESSVYESRFSFEALYNDQSIVYNYDRELSSSAYSMQRIKEAYSTQVVFPAQYEHLADVGLRHNYALERMNLNSDFNYIIADSNVAAPISNSIEDQIAQQVIRSSAFKSTYQTNLYKQHYVVRTYSLTQEDFTFDIWTIPSEIEQMEDIDPNTREILRSFALFYAYHPRSIEEVDTTIQMYVDLVNMWPDEDLDKNLIFSVFSVASYSPKIWMNHL